MKMNEEINMNAAERIIQVRKSFQMDKKQFAELLEITHSLVCSMEKGKATVSRKTMNRLEAKLGINPIWLQYGVGNMFSRQDAFVEMIMKNISTMKMIFGWTNEINNTPQMTTGEWQDMLEKREQLKKEVPERLVRVRNAYHLNQSALAKEIGCTRAYISAIEKGKQNLSQRMADMIESKLGISAAWLLYGTADNALCA